MPKILKASKASSKNGFFSNPLVVLLTVIIVLIVLLAIFRSVSPALTLGFGIRAHIGDLKGSIALEAYENGVQSDSSGPTFALFYSPTCPYCKLPLAGFEQLQQESIPRVQIVTVDCKAEEALALEHNITGYPTMRYYPKGLDSKQYQEYKGGREVDDLRKYANSLA
jgi:thiol-disulfide isomerase/thioredoxin